MTTLELLNLLNINQTGYILIEDIGFTLLSNEDKLHFLDTIIEQALKTANVKSVNWRRLVDLELRRIRYEKLTTRLDYTYFESVYTTDPLKAITELVQHPVSKSMFNKLESKSPSEIYEKYYELPLGSGLMDLTLKF